MDYLIIDGAEYPIPAGYDVKTKIAERAQSVTMANGEVRKDYLGYRLTFSLSWDLATDAIKEEVLTLYEKANGAANGVYFKLKSRDGSSREHRVSVNLTGWNDEWRTGGTWWYKNLSLELK